MKRQRSKMRKVRKLQMLPSFKCQLNISDQKDLISSDYCDKRLLICRKLRIWCAKWDMIISAIIAIVIFLVLIILVILHIPSNDHTKKMIESSNLIPNLEKKISLENSVLFSDGGYCVSQQDKTTCYNFDTSNMGNLINAINNEGDTKDLTLSNIKFANNRIEEGWLFGVEKTIVGLHIEDSDLKIIGPNSFSGSPFDSLTDLSLSNLQISELKRESFLNTNLAIFAFVFDDYRRVRIEEKVLEGMANTLQILQIIRIPLDVDNLENLTGAKGVQLSALSILSLVDNQIETITDQSFVNIPRVTTLDLTANHLRDMHRDSFPMTSLQTLTMDNNYLEYIPEGIFNRIRKGPISIKGNPWNCVCKLQWFKDFFKEHEDDIFSETEFLCWKVTPYDKVNFCGDNTTTSTTTTTISSTTTISTTTEKIETTPTSDDSGEATTTTTLTTPTSDDSGEATTTTSLTTSTPINHDLIWVNCEQIFTPIDHPNLRFVHSVALRENSVNFTISQMEEAPTYIFAISGDVSSDYLLWINVNRKADAGCTWDLTTVPVTLNLASDTTYMLCLVNRNVQLVSPYDCTALTVPPEWRARTWIANKSQTLVISAICGVIFGTILLSSLIMFYCIRQHPNLIKGNKRVIMVESKAADAIIMPKNYEQPKYVPPSLTSVSDGYLTPKPKYYDHYHRISGPVVRTISQHSISSSYPSNGRFRRGQTKKRTKLEQVARIFDEHIYEPPPLPPNHPCECTNKLYTIA